MTRSVAWILAAAVGSGSPAPAEGDPPQAAAHGESQRERAARAFEAGLRAVEAGDLERARAAFEQAYALTGDYRVLYNLGVTEERLGRRGAAMTALEAYLRRGGEAIDPARRRHVAAALARLRPQVGMLVLEGIPDGALVRLDGRAMERAGAPEPRYLDPGPHALAVTASGFAPFRREVEVEAGQSTWVFVPPLVPLSLALAIERASRGSSTEIRTRGRRPLAIATWTTGAAAVGSGLAWAIVGGLTVAARDDFERALGEVPGDPDRIEPRRRRMQALAAGTDATIALTSLLTAATLGLVFGLVVRERG